MPKKNDMIMMSATRINSYLSCRWKYWCNYVLRLPRKPNVSFKLGIAVHEALATAGDIWKMKEKFDVSDIERIKGMYTKVAAKEGLADTNLYHEGLQMVLSRVNNFVNGTILTVEDKFKVATDQGVMLVGAMDKVEELHDDTILVTDYKTSKYQETSSELKSDIQLSVYDIVAHIKYPGYKRIILTLDYLRAEPVYTYRTDQERADFLNYMLAIYNEMLQLKEDKAVPMLNDMCSWCDFTDHCTAYGEALSSKTFIKKNPEEYADDELVKNYMDIKSKKRILDNQEKQLKFYILNKIKSTEQDLFGAGKRLYIRQNSSTAFDPRTVYESVPTDDFLEMVNISNRSLDEYLTRNPINRAKIMSTSKKNYTSAFLSYKVINKEAKKK
jgi:RecB family exonuclease